MEFDTDTGDTHQFNTDTGDTHQVRRVTLPHIMPSPCLAHHASLATIIGKTGASGVRY